MNIYKYEIEYWANAVKGLRASYAGRRFLIGEVEIKPTLIKIHTDGKPMVILNEDWEHFKKTVEITEIPITMENQQKKTENLPSHNDFRDARMSKTIMASTGQDLVEILRDNIRKVQEDKNYIPQAQEIQNNARTIIELAKVEVEYYKAFNKS